MSAETFTRWTCDECGAQTDGQALPDDWAEHGAVTLCPVCRNGAAGEARVLLERLAAAEREVHEWKSCWRSVRSECDRLTAELARVRSEQRARGAAATAARKRRAA